MGSTQNTKHVYLPCPYMAMPCVCHFTWQSLQAIHHDAVFQDLWQRLFLIHKSQKDQFKIYEQSVMILVVSLGQWRRGSKKIKSGYQTIFLQKNKRRSVSLQKKHGIKMNGKRLENKLSDLKKKLQIFSCFVWSVLLFAIKLIIYLPILLLWNKSRVLGHCQIQ